MIDLRERYPDVTDLLLRVRLLQLHRALKFYDLPDRYSLLITYDDVFDPADEADSLLDAMRLLVNDSNIVIKDTYFEPPPPGRFINFAWEGIATDEMYGRYDAIFHLEAPNFTDIQAVIWEWDGRVISDDEGKVLTNRLFE